MPSSARNTLNNLYARTSLLLVVLISGCGYAEYEFRLNESKKYYAYLDKIEQSLAPRWASPGNVLELRVPRQFNQIPAPPPPPKDDDGAEQPIDQRQPDYLKTNFKFPGLFGAWEAPFKVTSREGVEERKGYIYALSNYWEFAGEHANDAPEFTNHLKEELAQKLRVAESDPRTETYPKVVPAYRPQLTYDVCSFKGKEIDGVNYSFDVYSRTNGSVIGVIVVVLPEGMDSPQKLLERIPLMLETFVVTKTPPKAGANANQPVQQNPGGAAF